mmetsp:Transcript_66584/g.144601  ORF Transcript_66584/g.144601 Transcript_66584/m.144601 type:complete len:84 (+) Transcript_66584:3480-3731(+)
MATFVVSSSSVCHTLMAAVAGVVREKSQLLPDSIQDVARWAKHASNRRQLSGKLTYEHRHTACRRCTAKNRGKATTPRNNKFK